MGLLLNILLLIFLYYVVKGALKLFSIYRKIHNAAKQFQNFGGYTHYGQDTRQGAGTASASQSRNGSTTTATGEVIEDRRTEDEINRKIFTQEEGEYVDFEEEK